LLIALTAICPEDSLLRSDAAALPGDDLTEQPGHPFIRHVSMVSEVMLWRNAPAGGGTAKQREEVAAG